MDSIPPPGLKEISSLASWTVSTAKPGNGVAALRSPDLAHFWQSDGPQPHLLSIHFFKLVSIVSIRVFLNFESDESYTPTKIQFLAGMGLHDMQEFSEMRFDQPNGWKDVDFSSVGPIEQEDDSDDEGSHEIDWSKRPVLRAFLLQVRILENHQNGKDTHLRAVQIFARDEAQQPKPSRKRAKPATALPNRPKAMHESKGIEPNNIKLASWMLEPDLR
jgi:anaphase-promoting complex subunit 10